MPIGTKLNTILAALRGEMKISAVFPVLSSAGRLVYLPGIITDVGDDYVKVQSSTDSADFYFIPISSLSAVTNLDPPTI
jgi:hypothetical protein